MKRFVQLAACSLGSLVYAQEAAPSAEGTAPTAGAEIQAVQAAEAAASPAPSAAPAPEATASPEALSAGDPLADQAHTTNPAADSTATIPPQQDPIPPTTEPEVPPAAPPASGEPGPLSVEFLMVSKELALSDTEALARALSDLRLSSELPAHLAVVQRFNSDMQLLATLLSWVGNKEEADLLSAPAGVLCRRGAELVNYFEAKISPHLSEEQQRELADNITPEQKQALAQVFQILLHMMQTGFHDSAELSRATAPLLKNMLGVPNP